MALTHRIPSSGKAGLFTLGGIALAAAIAAGVYWFGTPADQAPATAASASPASQASSPVPMASSASVPALATSAEAVRIASADLAQANQALAQDPVLKPITGPVTERPPYVSPMEWDMLKGVASQHATPGPELTRLVNSLRFNKQFETWEALPRTDANSAQRQALAKALMADLPERLRHQDMGIQDAQKAMAALLADIEPDEARRKALARDEGLRLLAAVPRNVTAP
ncbi:hypothetical protein EIP75_14400 [Aquabacterium soli]|uniref:Phospholipase C accessory protein PlcR n=1 Tax=Aquabacterium soli TaxID=2493092 RepID=A0A3R8TSC9_9BURK|nr:hypothetical protein [Aquabacterium soli]RRS03769.1 hypothetical protein EIP75_14400 [Aquabacterium soli]